VVIPHRLNGPAKEKRDRERVPLVPFFFEGAN
jgi:hypothetical protein